MLQSIRRALLLVATLPVLLTAEQALATAYTWNVAGPANWTTAGNWTPGGGPPTTGDTGTISSGTAIVDAALVGTPNITVNSTGVLSWNSLAGPVTGGTITVQSGGLLQWAGDTTNATSITLDNGSRFGKTSYPGSLISDNITVSAGATANANAIYGIYPFDVTNALTLKGTLNGAATSTILVKPNLYLNNINGNYGQGMLRLAFSSASPYLGIIQVEGLSSADPGQLALSGTGAMAGNPTGIVLNGNARLIFANATNPFGASAPTISVGSTDRVLWDDSTYGTTTYSSTPPTLSLTTGSGIGKTSGFYAASKENISIQSGQTALADGVMGIYPKDMNYGLNLTGQLSGDSTTTLHVKANLFLNNVNGNYGQGILRIAPTSANPFQGTIQVTGLSAADPAYLALGGTGALANSPTGIVLNAYSRLEFIGATNPFGAASPTISVPGTGRVIWDDATFGTTTYSGTPPTLSLANGAGIGKDSGFYATSRENISIQGGATVYADGIQGIYPKDMNYGFTLAGQLSGASNTTLLIQPNYYLNNVNGNYGQGILRIAPTSANPFQGVVQVQGLSANDPAYLGLGGTGAVANATVTLNGYARLLFAGATNPFGASAPTIVVNGTDRLMWDDQTYGTTTYSGAKPTMSLANGAGIGKEAYSLAVAKEILAIQSGATVYADSIKDLYANDPQYALELAGPITGNSSTTLYVKPGQLPAATTFSQGVLRIKPTAVGGNTGFAGTLRVEGTANSDGNRGFVQLDAVGALGAGKLDVEAFGTAAVTTNGALDGTTNVAVHTNGLLRLRNGSLGSTMSNTTLAGTGIVRAETGTNLTDMTTDTGLQTLLLSNVNVSPGFSAGTLTMQATTVTLGSGTALNIELGSLSDKLVVNGNLVLTAGSALDLSDLPGLTTGTYTIATYSGTLSGQFGSIVSTLTLPYYLAGINYGSLNNSAITLTIGYVPEPTTGMLATLGIATVFGIRRRQQRA